METTTPVTKELVPVFMQNFLEMILERSTTGF